MLRELAALQVAAQARLAQSALDLATRQASSDDKGAQNLAQLVAAAKQAAAEQAAAHNTLQSAQVSVVEATAAFANFNSPQDSVALLSESSPFLLFPVRIETRFRAAPVTTPPPAIAVAAPAASAAPSHQLLVRIYPDDCSIDTFEPLFSQSELTNVKAYWMNFWRAGGVENDQRAAWAALVAAQGSGRAGWLVDNFQPTNAAPTKVNTTDEILAIPTTAPLSAPAAGAITTYWQSVWLADGDTTRISAANAALTAAVGSGQASDLISGYAPFNLTDAPAPPLTKSSVGLSVAFVIFPADPPTTLQSWSQAPQVRQFPDRFVVLGFNETRAQPSSRKRSRLSEGR